MAHLLQLTLFGSPEVRLHGQPVTGFRSSKAQALLYYLAVTGRPHTRSTLAGLFWSDQPEDAARTSLRKCLSNLRDLVGEAVLVDRQAAAFNRNQPYDLDIEHFLAGIAQPPTPETIPAWQAALAFYRGDFLEGFYVRDASDFEQWVLVQRAHYREAVVQRLHTLADYFDQHDDLSSTITNDGTQIRTRSRQLCRRSTFFATGAPDPAALCSHCGGTAGDCPHLSHQ